MRNLGGAVLLLLAVLLAAGWARIHDRKRARARKGNK